MLVQGRRPPTLLPTCMSEGFSYTTRGRRQRSTSTPGRGKAQPGVYIGSDANAGQQASPDIDPDRGQGRVTSPGAPDRDQRRSQGRLAPTGNRISIKVKGTRAARQRCQLGVNVDYKATAGVQEPLDFDARKGKGQVTLSGARHQTGGNADPMAIARHQASRGSGLGHVT
ncbi:unnamed protein product [Taenia asiatica]|uniref:DUF4150 domain-containing protein n=1 Tax=Taenia asiatica TaxID=60517 RepID=A0A0R3WDJ8_TAEAS|nr:unnamed protein product [Taenia asiatica]